MDSGRPIEKQEWIRDHEYKFGKGKTKIRNFVFYFINCQSNSVIREVIFYLWIEYTLTGQNTRTFGSGYIPTTTKIFGSSISSMSQSQNKVSSQWKFDHSKNI